MYFETGELQIQIGKKHRPLVLFATACYRPSCTLSQSALWSWIAQGDKEQSHSIIIPFLHRSTRRPMRLRDFRWITHSEIGMSSNIFWKAYMGGEMLRWSKGGKEWFSMLCPLQTYWTLVEWLSALWTIEQWICVSILTFNVNIEV